MEQAAKWIGRATAACVYLQHPVLLVIRLYWGWSLMVNGWGKLHHIDDIARWFGEDLGIPFPTLNAYMAGGTEFVGSLLLILGVASRPAAFAVAFTMSVAYATSDRLALATLGTDPFCWDGAAIGDCFTLAAPFPYWFAAILVLVFGPGAASGDAAIGWWWRRRTGTPAALPRPVA